MSAPHVLLLSLEIQSLLKRMCVCFSVGITAFGSPLTNNTFAVCKMKDVGVYLHVEQEANLITTSGCTYVGAHCNARCEGLSLKLNAC